MKKLGWREEDAILTEIENNYLRSKRKTIFCLTVFMHLYNL